MHNIITTRFMVMPNSGLGNPNQYPIISSVPITARGMEYPKANYDLFAINAKNINENFVIFARPNARFTDEVPGINKGDVVNIFEFIYETLLKRCFSADNRACDLRFELDASRCEGFYDVLRLLPEVKPSTAEGLARTPMTRAFFAEMDRAWQVTGAKSNFVMHKAEYTADQCRAYFFPECRGECHRAKMDPEVRRPVIPDWFQNLANVDVDRVTDHDRLIAAMAHADALFLEIMNSATGNSGKDGNDND